MLTEASMSQRRFGIATTNKDYLEIERTFLERHGEDHFGWNRWRHGEELKLNPW
jgi:Asp/Glu/hydantoin racemase